MTLYFNNFHNHLLVNSVLVTEKKRKGKFHLVTGFILFWALLYAVELMALTELFMELTNSRNYTSD